jgi:polar amino acid transport system substrate-binding protein
MPHAPIPQPRSPALLVRLLWLFLHNWSIDLATYRGATQLIVSPLVIVVLWTAAMAQDGASFPRFRFKDPDATRILEPETRPLRLLTDRDFAPWSFLDEKGEPRGVSVDLALAACAAAKLSCTATPLAYAELQPALQRGEGDAIISGIRLTAALQDRYRFTKPYFLSTGRFVARAGASLASNDARALTAKRLGFAMNTAHEHFLKRYYAASQLQPFETLDAALEALRTGALDVVFGDSVSLAFWLSGTNSRKCCQSLGKSFIDRESFSRELVYVVPAGRENLRDIFDAALDELEDKGETARIFTAYLPGPVW